ncbi:MAG: hypothetical protein WCD79_05725 [Chthoniobacteraceae bacterium]
MKNSVIRKTYRFLMLVIGGWMGAASTASATPLIFNSTQTASPGEVVYLQGDNFSTAPQIWFHQVLTTDTNLTPDTQLTPLPFPTSPNAPIALTVRLPKNMPLGLYALWVKDSSGNLSAPVFVNRARAMSFEYSAVPASYPFRIFGRNLYVAGSTPTVTFTSGSSSYTAGEVTTYANNSEVLQITAPAGLPTSGTYTLNVSNGMGHNSLNLDIAPSEQTIQGRSGGADPFNLGVPWGSDFTAIAADVINVSPSGTSINPHTSLPYGNGLTTGTGGSNWINAIQQAIYDAGNPTYHPNGATVSLPSGTYAINFSGENLRFYGVSGTLINQNTPNNTAHFELNIPANVVLRGAGIGNTVIVDSSPSYNTYSFFVTLGLLASPAGPGTGSHSGIQGFTYDPVMTVDQSDGPPAIRNYANNSVDMFFDHISVAFPHGYFSANDACITGDFGLSTGYDNTNILLQNCAMSYLQFGDGNYNPFGTTVFSYGSFIFIRNNSISSWFRRLEIDSMDHVIIENNHISRDALFPPMACEMNAATPSTGGVQMTVGDNKVLNNIFDTINVTPSTPLPQKNDGETISSQGEPTLIYDAGTIGGVTSTTLTDPTKAWIPNFFAGGYVTILSGSGAYQPAALITGNTATTITISAPWSITPIVSASYRIQANAICFDYGNVVSSTGTTVTCSSADTVTPGTWFPTVYSGLSGQILAIVAGPGAGQWRYIASNTVNTITVTQPWTEIPTSSSTYDLTYVSCDRMLVMGNTFNGVPRSVALYCGSHDDAVVNNVFENSGWTIYMRCDERPTLSAPIGGHTYTTWDGRINLTWNDVITDNITENTTNTWPTFIGAQFVIMTGTGVMGTGVLGNEFRRNILVSDFASVKDGASGEWESYDNFAPDANPETNIPGLLSTIFDDNLYVNTSGSNTNYPAYLNTDSYQTAFLNQLNLGTFTVANPPYSDAETTGSSHASVNTSYILDPAFLTAKFSGTGVSTGGTNDLIYTGGAGEFILGTGSNTMVITSTNPFISGTTGSYLESTNQATGNPTRLQITPTTNRTSWERIFDYRTGQWLVNGGFDFFWRPVTAPTPTNSFRPIDISNGDAAHGLRLTFHNLNATTLEMEIITGTGGGGIAPTGTFAGGFTAGNIYHMGATYATNPATGATTVKVFAAEGTGAINTASTANLVFTSTFTLDPLVVTDNSGWLSGGVWEFGDSYSDGGTKTNDYDGLNLYNVDPGTFPALGN